MTDNEVRLLAEQARTHATNMFADITNAGTRTEHIRLTRLAVEADKLANLLEILASRPDVARGED